MADKGTGQRVKQPIGDVNNPNGLYRQMLKYFEYSAVNQISPETLSRAEDYLRAFIQWCVDRDIQTPAEVTPELMERYKAHLFYHRKKNGKPLTPGSQRNRLSNIKSFFRYLARSKQVLFNPLAELEMPRERNRLPRDVLSGDEVNRVLAQPNTATSFGLRDRAIMETMYSTGIRRLECVKLELKDVDFNRETLFVRHGKGGKERIIPIGKTALHWLDRYVNEVRVFHLGVHSGQALFLTQFGKPLSAGFLSDQVTRYFKRAGLTKDGSSHLFRHSMATHMLENGADIRYIQAMLGHSDVGTTEIYTHVSIGQLKQIHSRTHPSQLAAE
jgi:integrase/recombinase XerD